MLRAASLFEKFLWIVVLGAVVFFARWHLLGLQPDAALYAGLSLKVLKTGEAWLLSGTDGKFPQYFEHPPYFFQWGAEVLRRLGESDGAARAIGALPAVVGFLSILIWTWARFGWSTALLCGLMLASFGHYTKYAATSMLEGPLSLAVVWTAIASYELSWRIRTVWTRATMWALILAGLMLATASKGVAGFGAWGGACLSLGFALIFSERPSWKILFSGLFAGPLLAVTAAPVLWWGYQLFTREGYAWISGYVFEQVLKSVTSNRGDLTHTVAGDRLFFVKTILRDTWPWWWTVPTAWIFAALARMPRFENSTFWSAFRSPVLRAWSWNAAAFFLAFFIPFSLVRFQLAHYLHPTYLVLAPCGAFFVDRCLRALWYRFRPQGVSPAIRGAGVALRWVLVLGVGLSLWSKGGVTHAENRGQPFIEASPTVLALPENCRILVSKDEMDPYRMEAFALWYWKGRLWELVDREPPAKIALPFQGVYWSPVTGKIWGRGKSLECKI